MGGNFKACVGSRDECNEMERQAIGKQLDVMASTSKVETEDALLQVFD
jgi:hypothetical protein